MEAVDLEKSYLFIDGHPKYEENGAKPGLLYLPAGLNFLAVY